jgi:hypothetical protein
MNATDTLSKRPARREGLVAPAIMIGLGIVLLLNTLGLLGWEVWWSILRLWPLLLIAVGVDLMLGRRSALASLLVMVFLLGALALAVGWSSAWLGALEQPGQLIAGSIRRGPGEEVVRDVGQSGDTASFKLRSQMTRWFPGGFGQNSQAIWDLRLNRDVPTRLVIDTGAGTAALDLEGLRVTDLTVNSGIGSTTLTLPGQGHVRARVHGGVGQTTITIPAGVAARITASAGIGQVQVNGGFQRQGAYYTSPGYETAERRVEIDVDSGIGSITIQQGLGR